MRTLKLIRLLLLLALCGFGFPAFAAEKITYYHLDALGSPVAATDELGNVVWRETYAPYGDRLQKAPAAAGNDRWYTGKPYDNEVGLSYFGARWYDPSIGRFMGLDQASYAEGSLHSFNRYVYGNNSPYKYVDPDGNFAMLIIPVVILLVHSDYANAPALGQEPVTLSAGDHVGAIVDAMPAGRVISTGKTIWHATDSKAKSDKKAFSKEKQALVEMAKADKKKGITQADMDAYKELNNELPDPFPTNRVRGWEAHNDRAPHSQEPHGHVGPVGHIPITDIQP